MNSAKGFFWVVLFYALGSLLSVMIKGYLSGSVIGMILLFSALCLKWVKPRYFQTITQMTMSHMMLFFIPAGVGIVAAWSVLRIYMGNILLLVLLSLVMVLIVVAYMYLFLDRLSHRIGAKKREK